MIRLPMKGFKLTPALVRSFQTSAIPLQLPHSKHLSNLLCFCCHKAKYHSPAGTKCFYSCKPGKPMANLTAEFDLPYRNLYRQHRRSDSGELDVFDATSYFSGEEIHCHADALKAGRVSDKIASEELPFGSGRKSLDNSFGTNPPSQCQTQKHDKKFSRDNKHRTLNLPGSKLAAFLNSLFTQTVSKKKSKPKPAGVPADKNGVETPYGRMKRRSSMSHLHSVRDSEAESLYSALSASGFDSPPSFSLNARLCKEINGFFVSNTRSVTLFPPAGAMDEKRCINIAWLDQKFLFSDADLENFRCSVENNGEYLWKEKSSGKNSELINGATKKGANIEKEWKVCEEERTNHMKKERKWLDERSYEEATRNIEEDMEDGFESDSSSDLFELQKL